MVADPAPSDPELRVRPGTNLVTVIERYDARPRDQRQALAVASRCLREWTDDVDFVAGLLLRGRDDDRGGIATYVQWRAPSDGPPPDAVPTAWTLAPRLHSYPLRDSRTYRVEFTLPPGAQSPPVTPDHTPYAHLGVFPVDVGRQDRLLQLTRRNAPTLLGAATDVSVTLHRSLDGTQVVTLGVGSRIEYFDELPRRPRLLDDDLYWQTVTAGFHPELVDVVALEVTRRW